MKEITMGLNDFILNCEKENKNLKKDIEYYKNKSKRLEEQLKQRDKVIDEAINHLDCFISDESLSKYDTLKILMHAKKILKKHQEEDISYIVYESIEIL